MSAVYPMDGLVGARSRPRSIVNFGADTRQLRQRLNGRAHRMDLTLTQRDTQILTMVHQYSGVTIDHLQQRYFPTKGARSSCYARVQKLVVAGFLLSRRLGSVTGVGSGKAFLTLGPQGRSVIACQLGLPLAELGRSSRRAVPTLIHHHLAICDVRLSLELAAERSSVFTLTEWIPESTLRQAPVHVTDPLSQQVIPLVPDGAAQLALPDGTTQGFFFELDMGTIAPKRMQLKLGAYLATGSGQPLPVLFIVPDEPRQQALIRWTVNAAERSRQDPTLIWFTTRGRVTSATILDQPIWQVAGGPDGLSLRDVVTSAAIDRSVGIDTESSRYESAKSRQWLTGNATDSVSKSPS